MMMYSDMPQNCTVDAKGAKKKVKIRSTGYEKQHLMVM
jgi:hypothetical protein